jgi:uncharacterized membrane protein YciS (DUF1049 family)
MKQVAVWVKLAIVIIALFLGSWFALENDEIVDVILFGIVLPEYRLGVWLLAFSLVNLLLGTLLGTWTALRIHQRLKARERQLAYCERELDKLRTRSLRE